ncbi:MAG TPA: 16S rRNA (guanine(966)-N(2))-methyltransferase RsmD [Woeseiaceae bacterium]|nr:16S rRNA (guanine(966)-N(2))-methyltransferase RsmD [Woeseiaceae bacterium]
MTVKKSAGKKKSPAGQLRIVAGIWRSRRLQIADLPGLRPTSSRIRETLFNWLTPGIHGAHCLDLCAGTGALGIEALSRGAASAIFVERSALAAATLRSNLASLGARQFEVRVEDAQRFLLQPGARKFDIVFLDPPFAADLHDELCRLLDKHDWLVSKAKIYIELDKDQSLPTLPAGWSVVHNKTAGNVRYMLATARARGEIQK